MGARDAPIRYAQSGDVSIAFQVTGEGPLDLVLSPGFITHLEMDWEQPDHACFLERLGSFARLIRFDKRGTGLSDDVRAGVHTGEVERPRGGAPRGIAVHVGSRIASLGKGGDVLVSATTRDLVAGSGLEFVDRGEFELKGIDERRRVYAVTR